MRNGYRLARVMLIAVEVFVTVMALYGSVSIVFGLWPPAWLPLEWLRGSPFNSYLIPGLFLLVVIGGGYLISLILLWRRSAQSNAFAAVMGIILAVWILVQVAIIGWRMFFQPLMLAFGLVTLALALWLRRSAARWPVRPRHIGL